MLKQPPNAWYAEQIEDNDPLVRTCEASSDAVRAQEVKAIAQEPQDWARSPASTRAFSSALWLAAQDQPATPHPSCLCKNIDAQSGLILPKENVGLLIKLRMHQAAKWQAAQNALSPGIL